MYFNVNFNVFFNLKSAFLVSELYIIKMHGATIKILVSYSLNLLLCMFNCLVLLWLVLYIHYYSKDICWVRTVAINLK